MTLVLTQVLVWPLAYVTLSRYTPALDEIQANLVNAAKNGAAALVDYINSNEGQIYLDFRKERKIQIINTLNRELATNIKPQTFRIALNRKGIKNPTL